MAENKDVELGVSPEAASAAHCLIDSIRETLMVACNSIDSSIYKAPDNLRNLSPRSFTPQVVSIGPLHRNDVNLQRFEEQKYGSVNDLLRRLGSPEKAFSECMGKVVSKIATIKIWYANMESYDDMVLATMMVTDACFILEFIYKMSSEAFNKVRWQNERIPYDLVLLENQIPFFVLKDIYECLPCFDKKRQSLTSFIYPLLKLIDLFQGSIKPESSRLHDHSFHEHILHCLYNCYKPEETILSSFPRSTIRSVTELEKAGVSFKPNKDAKWPMAMVVKQSSWYMFKNPLKMPTLRVDVFTELVLRNLIAYEQSNDIVDPYVTSYARAMDMLIDTHEDVAKLVASNVMVNHIGSNEEAANMLNRICQEVAPRDFYYTKEWELMDKQFNEYWPKKIVNLKRTHFQSPWSIIALLAGTALFVLTLLQTIFTIKSS